MFKFWGRSNLSSGEEGNIKEMKSNNYSLQSEKVNSFIGVSKGLTSGCMELGDKSQKDIKEYNQFLLLDSSLQSIVKNFINKGNSLSYSLKQADSQAKIDILAPDLIEAVQAFINRGDSPIFILEQVEAYKLILELPSEELIRITIDSSGGSGYTFGPEEALAQIEINKLSEDLRRAIDECRKAGNGRAGALASVRSNGKQKKDIVPPAIFSYR